MHRTPGVLVAASVLLVASSAPAQMVTQRGVIEPRAFFFPQQTTTDQTRVRADLLAREEVFFKAAPWVQFAAGMDLRASSHGQVEDAWRLDISDRGVRRPRLAVRRLSATITRGWLTVDAGKQFIRWGKTDIVTPTDRFAPRDFLDVVDNEFLGVTGARAVAQVRTDSVDVVWLPRFTPSRIPLLDQRWTVVPPSAADIPLIDRTSNLPDRSQFGVRWNHPGTTAEYSLSFFDGLNHLPDLESQLSFVVRGGDIGLAPGLSRDEGVAVPVIDVRRVYPAIRSYGGDAAIPLRWFTLKAEAAYVTSSAAGADEYVLYVVQLERQSGEWVFVGGYAGEVVTARRARLTFAPDRGLTRAFVGRASYTIDANRGVAVESAVRQNLRGAWTKLEYSQARGDHWRLTATGVLIAGHDDDFLGQFHRNSHVLLSTRYSF